MEPLEAFSLLIENILMDSEKALDAQIARYRLMTGEGSREQ